MLWTEEMFWNHFIQPEQKSDVCNKSSSMSLWELFIPFIFCRVEPITCSVDCMMLYGHLQPIPLQSFSPTTALSNPISAWIQNMNQNHRCMRYVSAARSKTSLCVKFVKTLQILLFILLLRSHCTVCIFWRLKMAKRAASLIKLCSFMGITRNHEIKSCAISMQKQA